LQQRSLQTILILVVYSLTAGILPSIVHQFFYTTSLFIKDVLVWLMPLTVCFFIAHAIMSFERKAPILIAALMMFEATSNFASVWYALGLAHAAADSLPLLKPVHLDQSFETLWRLPFIKPQWWTADKGCIIGLMLGIINGFYHNRFLKNTIYFCKLKLEWLLIQVFSRLIPLFILGFACHMYQTNLLQQMTTQYGILLLWLLGTLSFYIIVLFAIGAGRDLRVTRRHIANLLPAGTIALTSGCSLSTLPWTIQGTARNLDHPDMAQAIIPATTNIQQIGDCIANSFLCFIIYRHFYGHTPDLVMLFNFSIAFVLARFATAAIIGGAIFIMLPIYEAYLNFTPEMIAVILALNVVLDPFITSSNVMANGALCRLFERLWYGLLRKPILKPFPVL
jgi:Na+/H+-dicarboxylate symporter